MMRASDTLADSRVQKPKNFLAFFSRLLPPPPLRREAEKEMERKFLVLLCRFSLRKKKSYFNIFLFALFSTLTATEAHSYPRFVVVITSANHTQPPTHSQLAFARAGCFGVVCVRLVSSRECSGNSNQDGLC